MSTWIYNLFLPTAIITYANLEINIPTYLKSKKFSAVCRKIGIKLYFASFLYVSKYCKINGCKHLCNKYAMFSFITQCPILARIHANSKFILNCFKIFLFLLAKCFFHLLEYELLKKSVKEVLSWLNAQFVKKVLISETM